LEGWAVYVKLSNHLRGVDVGLDLGNGAEHTKAGVCCINMHEYRVGVGRGVMYCLRLLVSDTESKIDIFLFKDGEVVTMQRCENG